jgi:hypothetical protein
MDCPLQLVILSLTENHTGLLIHEDTELSERLKEWTFLTRRERERGGGAHLNPPLASHQND